MSSKCLWHYLQAEAKPPMFVLPRISEVSVFSEESFLFKQYTRIKIQFFFRHNAYLNFALCFSLKREILISSLVSVLLFSLLHTKTIERKYLFYLKTLFRHCYVCHCTICPKKGCASPIDFATIRKLRCGKGSNRKSSTTQRL